MSRNFKKNIGPQGHIGPTIIISPIGPRRNIKFYKYKHRTNYYDISENILNEYDSDSDSDEDNNFCINNSENIYYIPGPNISISSYLYNHNNCWDISQNILNSNYDSDCDSFCINNISKSCYLYDISNYLYNISGITNYDISGLTNYDISGLTNYDISGLTNYDISGITNYDISGITNYDISGLTNYDISNSSYLYDISGITNYDISGLTNYDISNIIIL